MRILTSLIFFLFVSFSIAQELGTIEGIVLDKEVDKEPLAFAYVTLKNTTTNSITEFDGSYTISVEPGAYTVVFSFPGYQKIEIPEIIVKSGEITILENISLSALRMDKVQLSEDNKGSIKKVSVASLPFK